MQINDGNAFAFHETCDFFTFFEGEAKHEAKDSLTYRFRQLFFFFENAITK